MRHKLSQLPGPVRAHIWRILDVLGPVPQHIRRGPAAGYKIYTTLRRRQNFCFGTHEPHVLKSLGELVRPGMVALDIGAYVGYFTLAMAARTGPTGCVYGFEPNPDQAAWLRRSVSANGLQHTFTVPCALGSATGNFVLSVPENSSMACIRKEALNTPGNYDVEMTTLDKWFDSTPNVETVDFIKLDVEGMELDVLRGAINIIEKFKPQIICEIHIYPGLPHRPISVVRWMESRGYRVTILPQQQASVKSKTLTDTIAALEQKIQLEPRQNIIYVCHVHAVAGK